MVKFIMDVLDAALEGMRNAQSSYGRIGTRIGSAPAQPRGSVELSATAVALLATRDQAQAQPEVFLADNKMQERLLDIMV